MMNLHRRTILPLALFMFGMALPALACSIYLGGPELPGPAITPEGDKDSIEKSWANAAALSGDGTVTVVFTEAQMTAYLQQRLGENQGNTFRSAQVFLRDGRVKVYGMLFAASTSASAILVLRPEITEQGKINFVMEQAQVGPLDLPAGLLSAISNVLTEAFTGSVGSLATGFQVKEILVGEGQIAISGILR
jgi:hypothetical protein